MSAAVATSNTNGTTTPKKSLASESESTSTSTSTNATRKRAADAKAATSAPPAAKPSVTKRRRTGAAPKAKAKTSASASAKPSSSKPSSAKAAAAKKKAALPTESDSESESESESEEEEESESESESEESSDAKEGGPPQKATSPSPASAMDIISQPKRRLTADAIDELVPLILKNERPSALIEKNTDDGRVVVIKSMALQAMLNRNAKLSADESHKVLGVTREQLDKADAVVAFLHGPTTEEERMARLRYENEETQNYHWSVVCVFRDIPDHAFHYDSRYPINDMRCAEILGVLRSIDIVPKDVLRFTLPNFFPQQSEEWECGYYGLIALTIIAAKTTPAPITDSETEATYNPFFTTLAAGGTGAPFLARMRELITREKYMA